MNRDFDPSRYTLYESGTLRDAVRLLNDNAAQIVLILSARGLLIDTVTDGDIRRALLNGLTLDSSLSELQQRREAHVPVTARQGCGEAELHHLMQERQIRQIPILDKDGRVVDLVFLGASEEIPVRAVVMAGGFGKRLHPLTETTPKPMLPVGDRPLLERILERLHDSGIRNVNIATHHLADSITQYFGDGKEQGLHIEYLHESQPQGTGGALRMVEETNEPLLVINGDILTNLNFREMLKFHRENQAVLTMAVRRYDVGIPYGVVESDGVHITALSEKPVFSFFVNAGIYLAEPSLLSLLPREGMVHMTDLVQRLLDGKKKVINFPIHEYWLDIGSVGDYERANLDMTAQLKVSSQKH